MGWNLFAAGNRFHYFPPFVLLFTPFQRIPSPYGEIPWRLFCHAIFITGVYRLARRVQRSAGDDHVPARDPLLLVTLLTIPAALSAARNGQTNMPLAGSMMHAAVEMADARLGRAATWLVTAVLLKPLGLVLTLLAAAVHAPLRWRVALGLTLLGLLPYATQSTAYVTSQYVACVQSLAGWSGTTEHRFCDLGGLLRSAGLDVPQRALLGVRAAAALATLALALVAGRRLEEPRRALALLGLSASYLMIFNPMTETNSYVILSPVIGATAALALLVDDRRGLAWLMIAIAIGLGVDSYGNPIHPLTNLWLKPMLALVFLGWLGSDIVRARESGSLPPAGNAQAGVDEAL